LKVVVRHEPSMSRPREKEKKKRGGTRRTTVIACPPRPHKGKKRGKNAVSEVLVVGWRRERGKEGGGGSEKRSTKESFLHTDSDPGERKKKKQSREGLSDDWHLGRERKNHTKEGGGR